ncbi:hypothetical protein Ait01nite_037620 [Actinoplanes italicus]|uniref:Uncharacterized protein n=1 Tax=Actinoplanes italicus TaxID=113567 RepID=A0A2T0K870_9ACTN|nr:hypothetical protein CLV67_11020 [Actinoplanes italicus]GIE30717.1 hypothetical protein Ait01nite_037620 [Actinoplanes italicus]
MSRECEDAGNTQPGPIRSGRDLAGVSRLDTAAMVPAVDLHQHLEPRNRPPQRLGTLHGVDADPQRHPLRERP